MSAAASLRTRLALHLLRALPSAPSFRILTVTFGDARLAELAEGSSKHSE